MVGNMNAPRGSTRVVGTVLVLVLVFGAGWLLGRSGLPVPSADPGVPVPSADPGVPAPSAPVPPTSSSPAARPSSPAARPSAQPSHTDAQIERLFQAKRSDVQVSGSGTVTRLLADDNEGSRHQRFILELDSGLTLLVAHNIDVAPRLAGLKVGDRVSFYGEYVYSEQGGTVHWTHHDPDGHHVDGWLESGGRRVG